MKTNHNIENWDLLAKYFSEECTEEEIDQVHHWKNQSKENQIIFNQVKRDLQIINLNKSMNKVNVDSAWEKVKNRIQEDEPELIISEESKTRSLIPGALKYAAAIIVLVGLGFLTSKIYQRISNPSVNVQYAAVNEQGKEIVLPDGSTVVLNAESKISYPDAFTKNERRIILEGEAYFDVAKNPEKPFIIDAKDAEVRVLGTSFNVNASIPGYKVEVFVQSGLVQLSRKKDGNDKILINPGGLGVLDTDNVSKKTNTDKNIIAWKTKEIVFQEDSLKKVIQTLNEIYRTNIDCENEEVLNLKYTTTFKNQNIDSILNVICLTFDLKIINTEEAIYLVKYDS